MENAQPEPSMEEILASIRRIISEDDEEDAGQPASSPTAASVKPSPKPPQEPVAVATPQIDEDGAKPHMETEDVEMIKKNVAEAMADEPILDQTSADAASNAFQSLSQSVRVSDGPGRTLEDIVMEMLKPMVKDWLDANLPAIVEEKVEEEVQRVARRRR